MIEKQKSELLKPYIAYGLYNENFFNFKGLPVEIAKQLLSAWPNVDPKERQNRSPTHKKLVETAEQYNGTLNGYCIPTEAKPFRDDARISFDAIELKVDKPTAQRLKRNLKPDSFSELSEGVYRFWWD